jgi:argininosuccinate lyase
MLATLDFRVDRMRQAAGEHFATATDLADYLVKKGVPFREAHEVVGRIVRHALDTGATLETLTPAVLRRFSPLFEDDVTAAITVDASLRARAITGGTAPDAVRRALTHARKLAR